MTPDAHDRRRAFCARLKSQRERRATSLGAIADATKVKASLLDSLERGDVSRWPKGIYRRAFFRDYVTAIGLSPDEHVTEFTELFPDGEDPPPSPRPARAPAIGAVAGASAPQMRLMLAEADRSSALRARLPETLSPRDMARNAAAAVIELALVSALSYAVSRWTGNLWLTAAAVSSVYMALGTIVFGRSPLAALVARMNMPSARLATPPMPDVRQLTEQMLRGGSVVRELIARLATSRAAQARYERERELSALRQRRTEAANSNAVDEISEVLG